MATTTVEFNAPSGLTLTAELYLPGSDVLTTSAAATERSNNKGCYAISLVDIATATYKFRVRDASDNSICAYRLNHVNAAGTEEVVEPTDVTLSDEQIDDLATAISASTCYGAGARTVVITVTDDDVPANNLEGAKVRVTNGADSYIAITNVSGQITFNLDDATWTVSITKSGYSYAGTTIVVNGNETATYAMTTISITASPVLQSTGYLYCYDEDGNVEAGVSIYIKQVSASPTEGYAFDSATRTGTSAADGLVEFTKMWQGARYRVSRNSTVPNTSESVAFTVPTDASFELPSVIGRA